MTWVSLGSLALPTTLNRHGVALRSEVTRLSIEMTSGESTRPAARLRGDLGPLAAIESRLARIAAWTETARLSASAADAAQAALTRIADQAASSGNQMLAVSVEGMTPDTLRTAAAGARAALGDVLSALSGRVAGRALFSGSASDTAPLPDLDTILGTLTTPLTGLTTAEDVATAVNAAFLDPGGLFETAFYQGGAEVAGAQTDAGTALAPLPTAADPALRRALAGLAISALAADPALALSDGQRRALARAGAESLLGAAPGLGETQARVGELQSRVDAAKARLSGERDALSIARTGLVGADPYETAVRLQEAQVRLEALFAVTARSAHLTLVEYL